MESEQDGIKGRLRKYSSPKPSSPASKDTEVKVTNTVRKEKEEDKMSSGGAPTPDPIPEEIDLSNMTTEGLARMIMDLTKSVNGIRVDMQAMTNSKSSLELLVRESKQELKDLKEARKQIETDTIKIKLLTATVIRQDQKLDQMSKEIDALKKQNKKYNIRIDGIIEDPEKEKSLAERKGIVQVFFKEQMEIDQDIPIRDVYRIGKSENRSMFVTLESSEDKAFIFSNVAKLKKKVNARKKLYFVSSDMLEEEKEKRQYFKDLQKENALLEKEEKLDISMRKGRLYANNSIVKQKLVVPSAADILTLSQDEISELKEVKTYEAGVHEESASEFRCYYQRINSIDEVQQGIAKLRIKHGDATHIVSAHRLESPKGPFDQGYLDDGEPGAGRKILQTLKDKEIKRLAVYVVRYYGGQHLGKRRFDIYESLTKKAVQKHKSKMDRLNRSSRNERSASQLSQLSELSQDETEG